MKKIIGIIVLIIFLAGAWFLGSPLFLNKTVDEPMPPSPTQMVIAPAPLATGTLSDGDGFHKGSGTVKIFTDQNNPLLRIENLDVTNGPDLFVYLTKNPNPNSSEKVKEGFYNVGRLKGNKGNQNYMIPANVNLNDYKGVVIYCRAFSVLFSFAPLNF